jgi:eukaryotic-like serine/threonine-protein kinase
MGGTRADSSGRTQMMIGRTLDHYRVLAEIGSGGMGEVYRATDDRLGRDVALKVLKPSLAQDRDRLRRFELEARSAALLNHPNIVAIYDIGMHDGAPYIVSELLQGKTLRECLLNGPLPLRQAGDYAGQIAQGLVAAHEKQIVHRDLKPENLFVTHDGRVKILDFGIAKLTSPDRDADPSVANLPTQTKSGSLLGTIAYMSPEQLRARTVDHRSDIFSFGAILYEMLTGKRAFSGQSEVDTITAVLKEDPPQMTLVRQSIPTAYERIVRHCLEKEPEERFQSARELAFALSTLSDLSTNRPIVPFRTEGMRWRKWLPWALAAVLVPAAGILAGFNLRSASNPVYRRLTFERGTIYSARFAPDGGSIVYGAAWNGRPLEIFSTLANSPLEHPLGLPSAHLLSLSRSNELALSLHGTNAGRLDFDHGMLASAPLAGGTPREILQDTTWADWSPDGKLAVVHHVSGHDQLEYPIGNVLYSTNGSISNIRFSPQGERIAFMDHPDPWDDRGSIGVVDLKGQRTTLSSEWESESGLAWSPSGEEVWFTAVESGSSRAVWAVSLSGKQRQILGVPGGFTLEDIAQDGRILATSGSERLGMDWTGKVKDAGGARELSWYDWTIAKDISADGQWVLFEESSEPAGANYSVAIRKIDGSPPIRLGDGTGGGLSPDGKWAASVFTGKPERLTLLPVGPGQPRDVPLPGLENLQNGSARFLADGKRLVIDGNEPGRPTRTFVVDSSGGTPRPVTPEGTFAILPSPDGRFLAGATRKGVALFPVDGGDARVVPQTTESDMPAQWSADSRALFVYLPGEIPLKLYRLDIATGRRDLVKEIVPDDRGGVVSIGPLVTNASGTEFAYSYYQVISVLYVVSGLR